MLEERYAQSIVKEVKLLEVDGNRSKVKDHVTRKMMWELSLEE